MYFCYKNVYKRGFVFKLIYIDMYFFKSWNFLVCFVGLDGGVIWVNFIWKIVVDVV